MDAFPGLQSARQGLDGIQRYRSLMDTATLSGTLCSRVIFVRCEAFVLCGPRLVRSRKRLTELATKEVNVGHPTHTFRQDLAAKITPRRDAELGAGES